MWIHFLTDATGGDEELIRFLQLCGGEGLIAELVCVESGRISSQVLLLGAGVETTTHLISGSVYEVLRAPNLRDWLREDWGRATLRRSETEPPGFSDWSMKRWRSPRAASQDWA